MTVFVVQKQMRFDKDLGRVVPRFPAIVKAARWGELKFMLDPNAHPFDPDIAVGAMHKSMPKFTDQDYLVLIGSPTLLGIATALAAHRNNGQVNFLQWLSRECEYAEIRARIF